MGKSSSKTSSKQQATNQQTTVGGSGYAIGGEAFKYASGTINITSPEAFDVASHAIDQVTALSKSVVDDVTQGQANALTFLAAQTAQNTAASNQAQQTALEIAANAAPQTSAAQSEILAGSSPSGDGSTPVAVSSTVEHLLLLAALALGAYTLVQRFKKA